MNAKRHLLVIDPTAYAGGSKIATRNILNLLNKDDIRITILASEKHSWDSPEFNYINLFQFNWLAKKDQGIAFFLRHIVIVINILLIRFRTGKIDIALGASGPGVDLAIYLTKRLFNYKTIQLIHGPVACSRTIGRCLKIADEVHYLKSSENTLLSSLSRVTETKHNIIPDNFYVMNNGLPEHLWPSECNYKKPVLFWAASLLKWKGIDTLINAIQSITPQLRPETHICYIKPKATSLPVSNAPIEIENVYWYETPGNLDELRSCANIFVSTSQNEPFGLSILESMAAGHCVLIPEDGSYWDNILEDNISCIKYLPGDATDLAYKLTTLSNDIDRIKSLGLAARKIASSYRSETQYAKIKDTLENRSTITPNNQSAHTKVSS